MNEIVLPVNAGVLPSGFCPSDYQDMLNAFSAVQSVTFPSTFQGIIVSGSKPTDTTRAWYRLDTLGRPTQLYVFAQGAWLALHPLVPGHIMIWTGALPNFTTFDGGDTSPAGPASGPMWEVATELQAKFPIGAGTLPSGTVINGGDTGGSETVTLNQTQIPPHQHKLEVEGTSSAGGNPTALFQGTGLKLNTDGGTVGDPASGTPPTKAAPFTILPPYLGVFYLKRSGRLFYAVN